MLRAIFVFHDFGHLIYNKTFEEEVGNADLISGLLSAINMFANQIKAGDINSIEMQNYKLVGIKSSYSIRFVSIIDITDRVGECLNFLTNCEKSFVGKFKDDLKEIEKGDLVNTETFSLWETDLKDLATDVDFSPIETVMGSIIQELSSKLHAIDTNHEQQLIEPTLVADPPVTMVKSVMEPEKITAKKKKKAKKKPKKKAKKAKKTPKKKQAKSKTAKKKKAKTKKKSKKGKTSSQQTKTKKKGRKKK